MRHILLFFIFIVSNSASSEVFWQLGAGLGNITANSYPGSDQTVSVTSPIPYLKIKTEWFDLDREGLHTNWFENTNFRLDFSFDLGLPVDSSENELRAGMPDLDPVAQIGPLLIYRFPGSKQWQLQLPLTYAYSFDNLNASSAGRVLNPRIYFNSQAEKSDIPFDISASFGPVYGSEDFHQYYYSVDSDQVNISRTAYQAKEGFAGYRLNLSLTRRMKSYWLGLYLRYQNIDNGVFVDSPLVNQNDYWMIALGASWLFAGNL
ncbi:MAG: MipA/OmpV family protein [Gammaproteobacteria bacterium]|nr:MipA/OmpV family protein [Gammaproteobacteria bacterium]